MSKSAEQLFSVTLKHLSPDVKKAAAELPEAQLYHVSVKQIRALLDNAAALAPGVAYPVEPELRITGNAGKFVVQLKAGGLQFVSWSSSKRPSGKITPAQIVAAITGEETEEDYSGGGRASSGGGKGGKSSGVSIGMLVVAIIAVNSFTVWFMMQPPKTLLPKFTLMQKEPAERLLSEVAGVYETGGSPGDRRFTVLAAEAGGKPALVTSKKSLITIKDQLSVVLYGDTYQRVPQ
ncbi:MAG: hypothetical protein NTV51_01745 [Verrucomicrobia bacterium]|nr:hypothetical protein [Verrucomicrobiota bacterium]